MSGQMRIEPVLPAGVDLDALETGDRLLAQMRGIFAHRPDLAPAFTAFSRVLHESASLQPRLRELVRLRIAFHNQCRTCMSIRYATARVEGVGDGLVCALQNPSDSADLSARERIALHFADLFATDHLAIDDATFDELREQFEDGEIVELAMVCAHYVASGRLMAIMRVTDGLPDEALVEGTLGPWDIVETIEFD